MFKPGVYNIQGSFCICEFNGNVATIINKIPMIYFKFEVSDEYVIWDCVQHINTILSKFLKDHNLKRWFPARQLVYNYDENSNTITINYYHDQTKHHKFLFNDTGTEINESESLVKSREDIYEMYGLDSSSKEIYAE